MEEDIVMATLFSRRAAGLSSITASALIFLNQLAQIILVLTVSESLFNATQSIRFGLALLAMYVLLLALTALHWIEANVVGGLGLVGYPIAFLELSLSPATGGTRRSLPPCFGAECLGFSGRNGLPWFLSARS
jgi:hypothetical protein